MLTVRFFQYCHINIYTYVQPILFILGFEYCTFINLKNSWDHGLFLFPMIMLPSDITTHLHFYGRRVLLCKWWAVVIFCCSRFLEVLNLLLFHIFHIWYTRLVYISRRWVRQGGGYLSRSCKKAQQHHWVEVLLYGVIGQNSSRLLCPRSHLFGEGVVVDTGHSCEFWYLILITG